MMTNGEFGKFLYELRPQTHPVKLTLYNFIRNYTDLNATFSPDTILKFYFKALSFEHWQKNNLELAQEVRLVLQKLSQLKNLDETFKKLKHSDQIQILKFFHKSDQLEMIHNYFKNKKLNYTFKVYSDKGTTAHAVLVFPHGLVHVYSFDDQAAIINGQLKPLSLDRKLEYTPQLELSATSRHSIQVSRFVEAHFHIQKNQYIGEYIRGYTLQAYKKFEVSSLQEELQLLYAIKKIERFFIDRASEPLYLELIHVLEQTIEFLKKNHPGCIELGQKAYSRGHNALENLFIDDKMIHILLKEIQNLLSENGVNIPSQNNRGQKWNETSDSTNSSLNPESQADELLTSL
jgi:hypothetical protein